MKCVYRMRPYEAVPGTTNKIHRKWAEVVKKFVSKDIHPVRDLRSFVKRSSMILIISRHLISKPRVGIVGEILVKFLPAANNHLAELLESEGAEAVVPDLLDFLLYCFYNQNFKVSHLGMKKSKATGGAGNLGIKALEGFRSPLPSICRK